MSNVKATQDIKCRSHLTRGM